MTSPPIINKEKPSRYQHADMPKETAWRAAFQRLFAMPNARAAILWLTGGLIFTFFGKKAIKKREEELVIEDIENYLKNKRN